VDLGTKVLKKRKEKDFTQEALSKKLGITAAHVSQIENGQRRPSYSVLIKLAHVLDIPIDYFLRTDESSSKDPASRFIENAISFFNSEQKHKVIDYLYQLTGTKRYKDLPILNSPTEYPQFLLDELKYDKLPIDPFEIAEKLEVDIIFSSTKLKHEAMLYKNIERAVIILDTTMDNDYRQRFSVAMMIGHLIIPWHLRPVFSRERDQKSLEQKDPFAIEARQFAGELLIPSKQLFKDFDEIGCDLNSLERIAYSKYGCSMLAIGHKYVDRHGKTTALLTSEDGRTTRAYSAALPYTLLENPGEGSFALSFISGPPKEREYRKGFVDAKSWVKNPPKRLQVHEESLLDPNQGVVVTLLKFSRSI